MVVVSVLLLIGVGLGLTKISKTGTLLPLSLTVKKGTMYFEGASRVTIGQPFVMRVMIDTNNQNVNATGVYIRFDPERLLVNDINTLNSFCQFYPEKKFDNQMGIVSLACGAPHPGIKGKNQLIEINITPLIGGSTTLRVTKDSKLLLSDGKGTNILDDYPLWEVQVATGL